MPAKPPLKVFLAGLHIADLLPTKPWDVRCRYTSVALDRWPINTALISCSLPTGRTKTRANAFARGLLPEGAHLTEVASMAKVPSSYTYDLLARFGRDIAGALTITVDDDPGTDRWSLEPLSNDQMIALVHGLGDGGLGLRDDSELSLAGVQNKMVLTRQGDSWARPMFGHPSTHIFKLDDPIRPGLVVAEQQCLALATRLGLSACSATVVGYDGIDCLVVERYDRVQSGDGSIERVHQEDACQALDVDIDTHRGRGKYEMNGGPSYSAIAHLFDRYAIDPVAQKLALLDLLVFTTAIGNADLHGKNISLLHDVDGSIRLAPIYDCVPTALWPRLRASAAMSINGHFPVVAAVDDIILETHRWNLAPHVAMSRVESLIDRIEAATIDISHSEVADLVARRCRPMRSSS
jgi:serine/threonine-protein kinase HipA